MKVTQTIQATDSQGEALDFTKPVVMKWYEGDSLIELASAVTGILAASTDQKFTKTVAIHIEL